MTNSTGQKDEEQTKGLARILKSTVAVLLLSPRHPSPHFYSSSYRYSPSYGHYSSCRPHILPVRCAARKGVVAGCL
jgi:hypothetical protein